MAGRSQVLASPAYAALSVGGKRVLHVIEQAGRGDVAISIDGFMEHCDLCRSAVRYGIRQCEVLGFVTVAMGPRRTSQFQLSDGWKSLDAGEAARLVKHAGLPTPPRARTAPPRAVVRQAKVVRVEEPAEQPPPAASAVNASGAMGW